MATRLLCSPLGRRVTSLAGSGRNLRDVGLTAQRSLTNISIGVPSNINETEKRVALVPDDVAKLVKLGATVTYVFSRARMVWTLLPLGQTTLAYFL